MEEEPLEYLRPTLTKLLNDTDHNKQRAAAEPIAGIIGGSKHWPADVQDRLWTWLRSLFDKMLGNSVKPDTLLIWTSFLEVHSRFRLYLMKMNDVSHSSTSSTTKILAASSHSSTTLLITSRIVHSTESYLSMRQNGLLSLAHSTKKWAGGL